MIELLIERDKTNEYGKLFPVEGEYSSLQSDRIYYFLDMMISTANANSADSDDTCFFGGWPSIRVSGRCRTPWKFSSPTSIYGATYDRNHYCGHRNMFRCNPIFFGPGDGRNRFERNNGGVSSGACIDMTTSPNGIQDVTRLCYERQRDNIEAIFTRYRNDAEFREHYDNTVEAMVSFCREHPTYDACEYLLDMIVTVAEELCTGDQSMLDNSTSGENLDLITSVWARIKSLFNEQERREMDIEEATLRTRAMALRDEADQLEAAAQSPSIPMEAARGLTLEAESMRADADELVYLADRIRDEGRRQGDIEAEIADNELDEEEIIITPILDDDDPRRPPPLRRARGLLQFPTAIESDTLGACGSFHYAPDNGRDVYSAPLTGCVFSSILQEWNRDHCTSSNQGCRLSFGNISHETIVNRNPSLGWPHRTHTQGECIDIRPMRTGSFTNSGLTFNSSDYDSEKTKDLIRLLIAAGGTNIHFNDPAIYRDDPDIGPFVTSVPGHHNHIHVCFRSTSDRAEQRCEQYQPDYNQCPMLQNYLESPEVRALR